MAAVKVLVAGASGFVGRRLCPALAGAGHHVAAMTRNPYGYTGAGRPVHGDVHEPATLDGALAGCEAAYYLVHSLADPDFERKDAAAAVAFGHAAARAGLRRIIYLGGLGDATAVTRNPALVLAGIATSVLFGLQRHISGGILAPALSHVTWSLLMLTYLPPCTAPPPAGRAHPRPTGGRRPGGPA